MKTNLTNDQITEVLRTALPLCEFPEARGKTLYEELDTEGHLTAIRALRDRGCGYTFISGIFGMSPSWSAVALHRDANREARPDYREEAHQATTKLKWLKTTLEEFRTEYQSALANEATGEPSDKVDGLLRKLEDFLQ